MTLTNAMAVLSSIGSIALIREQVIVAAFWTLVGAAAFVSLGAWILLRREIRRDRALRAADAGDEPIAGDEPVAAELAPSVEDPGLD
jgi:hypothetical protein